jgi:SAM-dependent methyltransferase
LSVRALLHRRLVDARRVRVLSERIAAELPQSARLLDVGCGDARIPEGIARLRPDLDVHGLEVWKRPTTAIPVEVFDGERIPHADASFGAVVFVDVLHHTHDPTVLLREAKRVARRCIVIKDHNLDGWLAGPTLRLMDHFGNPSAGVDFPYNYWPRARWQETFEALGLRAASWSEDLRMFPPPASWLFGRSLHFLARLEPT